MKMARRIYVIALLLGILICQNMVYVVNGASIKINKDNNNGESIPQTIVAVAGISPPLVDKAILLFDQNGEQPSNSHFFTNLFVAPPDKDKALPFPMFGVPKPNFKPFKPAPLAPLAIPAHHQQKPSEGKDQPGGPIPLTPLTPLGPLESAEPLEPAKPLESAEPLQSESAEPLQSESAEPLQSESAEPLESESAEPLESAELLEPAEPLESAELLEPAEPLESHETTSVEHNVENQPVPEMEPQSPPQDISSSASSEFSEVPLEVQILPSTSEDNHFVEELEEAELSSISSSSPQATTHHPITGNFGWGQSSHGGHNTGGNQHLSMNINANQANFSTTNQVDTQVVSNQYGSSNVYQFTSRVGSKPHHQPHDGYHYYQHNKGVTNYNIKFKSINDNNNKI